MVAEKAAGGGERRRRGRRARMCILFICLFSFRERNGVREGCGCGVEARFMCFGFWVVERESEVGLKKQRNN